VDQHYLSEAERTSREAAVERIARSQGFDAGEVECLYESVLAEMKREAIIMDFLPIFAARKVKEMLLHKRGPSET
jgi:hypothetical protein